MEAKFAAVAITFTDLNIDIGASAAGARNGCEICREGSKCHRPLHASTRHLHFLSNDNVSSLLSRHGRPEAIRFLCLFPAEGMKLSKEARGAKVTASIKELQGLQSVPRRHKTARDHFWSDFNFLICFK